MDPAKFDRLSRLLSTRRGVLSGALGSLVSLISLAVAGPDAAAKSKSCTRKQKRCGRACIPRKACCRRTERRCGKRCIPKTACCPRTEKRCGKRCIPKTGCCDPNECGAFNICVKHTCVIGRGTCNADSNYCFNDPDSRCSVGTSDCGCFTTVSGDRRCGDTRFLKPETPCENDAQCGFAFPQIPGVFCVDGQSGIACFTGARCMAPCPG